MNRIRRLKPSRTSRSSTNTLASRPLARLGATVGVLILLILACVLVAVTIRGSGQLTSIRLDMIPASSLNPLEATYLTLYLSARQQDLTTPNSSDETIIRFEVLAGETGSQIADNLESQSIVGDSVLFRNYMRFKGVDTLIEAGTYQLSANMTIPELVDALSHSAPPEITIRITEGWRREQIADWLEQEGIVPFTGEQFLSASSVAAPALSRNGINDALPLNATLEGFLFPDTYKLTADSDAADLIDKMLVNFNIRFSEQLRSDLSRSGLTLFEVITLASIVEREAVVPEERPIIASVYINRLLNGMNLEADPTVQYAMGYQPASDQWWNLTLTQEDYASVISPYNTYLNSGLPPGPIANPGLSSISAVIYPANTQYLFFRATCDGSGRHLFAITYEEHVGNACP